MNVRSIALCLGAVIALTAARPVAPEDLYKIAMVSNPQISPDGKRVAFVVTRANGPKDSYDTDIYLVSTAGGPAIRIAKTGRDSQPAWSPDSRTLAFVRAPEKHGAHAQIFSYTLSSGAVRQLSHVPAGAGGPVYSHGGTRIAFTSTTVDPPAAARIDFAAAGFKPKAAQKKSDVRIIHDLSFEGNGAGYTYDRHDHLWVMNADGSHAHALTRGHWSEDGPAWSPDDKTIAFNSLRYDTVYGGPNDIYTIPAAGGAMHKIASAAISNGLLGYDRSGRLWTLRSGVKDPAAFPALVVSGANGANARTVIAPKTVDLGDTVLADMGEPGGLCGPWFAPGDRFAIADENLPGFSAIVKVDPSTGALTQLTQNGEAAECTMNSSGTLVAYTRTDFTHPREVYVLDLASGKSTRLTHFNDA
ncbi:MAG TPA: hypothetical protein VFL13_11520 [Candidatus Baltobacteraceae bacterium]|nr:hypothetical protein [Candidatus Baltobacteraceae bacterium]